MTHSSLSACLQSSAYMLFYVERHLNYKPNTVPSYVRMRENEAVREKERELEKEREKERGKEREHERERERERERVEREKEREKELEDALLATVWPVHCTFPTSMVESDVDGYNLVSSELEINNIGIWTNHLLWSISLDR